MARAQGTVRAQSQGTGPEQAAAAAAALDAARACARTRCAACCGRHFRRRAIPPGAGDAPVPGPLPPFPRSKLTRSQRSAERAKTKGRNRTVCTPVASHSSVPFPPPSAPRQPQAQSKPHQKPHRVHARGSRPPQRPPPQPLHPSERSGERATNHQRAQPHRVHARGVPLLGALLPARHHQPLRRPRHARHVGVRPRVRLHVAQEHRHARAHTRLRPRARPHDTNAQHNEVDVDKLSTARTARLLLRRAR